MSVSHCQPLLLDSGMLTQRPDAHATDDSRFFECQLVASSRLQACYVTGCTVAHVCAGFSL